MVKVAENVYAVMGLFHPLGVNAGFIVTSDGVVVVDSGWTVDSALTILGYAKAASRGKSVKYLIWTEHHSDHIFGSCVFAREGARIIAHRNAVLFLKDIGGIKNYVKFMKEKMKTESKGFSVADVVFEGVEEVEPDIVVESERIFEVGSTEIVLIPLPGHTPSNMVVYLPQHRVLFSGDAIYSKYPPNTRFSTRKLIEEWIKGLEKLLELKTDVIVPGHGPLCGKSEIERNLRYLKSLLSAK